MILTHAMFDFCLYENVFLFRNTEKDAWTIDVNILPPCWLHTFDQVYSTYTLYSVNMRLSANRLGSCDQQFSLYPVDFIINH